MARPINDSSLRTLDLTMLGLLLSASGIITTAHADGLHQLPDEIILIQGTKLNRANSAQNGQVHLASEQNIALRPADVLENVPGLVVTQHSGSGKANQYFLRGFNLDHGTDFATSVDGMAVNARSHGHGQGYTDLNFLIPELLGQLNYQKGPAQAQAGDFASAGSADLLLRDQARSQLGITVGAFGYRRLLGISSQTIGQGQWLNALEAQHYNGPWQGLQEQVEKYNLWSRYSQETVQQYFSLTLMAYQNQWNSADQIPQRLIDAGQSRFLTLDDSAGGESHRYSISTQWLRDDWALHAYALQSRLDLWSNFTYFLQNPELGDQFYQVDDRRQWGAELSRQQEAELFSSQWQHEYGLQYRQDQIAPIELARSQRRQRIQSLKLDEIDQWSVAAFSQQQWQFSDTWSVELGLRYDWLDATVEDLLFAATTSSTSKQPATASAQSADGIASVRSALTYQTEQQSWSISYGQGMHSNDARLLSGNSTTDASTLAVDQFTPASLWSRTEHSAISWQANIDTWQYSAGLWQMFSEQELVYVADAAETQSKGASQRYGVEGTLAYQLNHQWSTSLELALTRAQYRNTADGRYIEGSVPRVVMAKLQYHSHDNLAWLLKVRHLGPRYLDSSGTERASSVTQLSMQLSGSVQFGTSKRTVGARTSATTGSAAPSWQWQLELHNALNSRAADIQYFYESRLANETMPVADRHLHPLEPRMLRFSVSYLF